MIIPDEVADIPAHLVNKLRAEIRAHPDVVTRIVATANPGGVNHSTLAERYVLTRTPWVPFEYAEQQWCYCPSTIDDNPHLPEAYHRNFAILRKTDPALYEAHRFGDWSRIVGDYFQGVWTSSLILGHRDLAARQPTSLSRDERVLASTLNIFLPEPEVPDDFLDAIRGLDCVGKAWISPEVGLPGL